MRLLKPLAITLVLLLLLGGAVGGYLHQKGYFADPQIALRSLKKRQIPATSASVHKAAAQGDLTLLQVLARAQCDFNEPDNTGKTALIHALLGGHVGALEILSEQGCDLNARDQVGNTPLSILLDQNLPEVASRLVDQGANPNFTLPSGELALPGYQQAKRPDDVAFLLAHNANPNSPSLDGTSPLALALQDGQSPLACKLIEKGAKPNGLIFGEPALVAVLKEHQNWKLETADTMQVLGTLLVSGADVEKPGSDGLRPLQIAISNDFRPSLELLMPRAKDVSGSLWSAIAHDNVAAIQNLLAKGSPVEEIGPNGDTPLIHAIRHGKPDLLDSLLTRDADANQFCDEGQRAIFLALALEKKAVISTLIQHKNKPEITAVMEEEVREEFQELYGKKKKGLLHWYCNNETGLTPLMFAVLSKNISAAELFLNLGADKFQGTASPGVVYPIQMAAANGDVKMQQLLIGVPYEDEKQVREFVIDLSSQKVTFYKNGEVAKTSRISSGKSGHRTPTGSFVITDKTRNHRSNLYGGAEMNYFQRFSCRAEGFHEGYTGSSFASHGCVRLPRSTAQFFWKETKIGDRVKIQQ